VEVREGEAYAVSVEVSSGLLQHLKVRKAGRLLDVGFDDDVRTSGSSIMRAFVTTPRLEKLESSGALELRLYGCRLDRFDLYSSGALSLAAEDTIIERLALQVSGAADVELGDTPIGSADVRLSGAGRAALLMNGGDLTGHLSGATRLVYYGTVRSEDVATSGLSSYEKRSR
jgi:hypothetical protein